jgi:flagellar protein FliL
MKRLILPLILLLAGVGGGVAAGLYAVPPQSEVVAANGPCGPMTEPDSMLHDDSAAEPGHGPEGSDDHSEEASDGHGALGSGKEYVRLNNQFVVPIVETAAVSALVVLSISVEVPAGEQEAVLLVEPKLRDVFLQVLFDHANTGGFEGMFTASDNMRTLRNALLRAAQDALGPTITDVLIVEIVRQDV